MRRPFSVVRTVPPSDWMAMISAGLPWRLAVSASVCATTCSHPSAMTSTAPTFGMPAIRRERVVRHPHVRPELPASGEVRQRHRHRRRRCGDALGDDRRADHRRHDEDVIARADAAVRAAVAEEAGSRADRCRTSTDRPAFSRSPRSSGGSAEPRQPAGGTPAARSPRPRLLATLCVWTCAPAAMSAVARPIGLPYLITGSPAAIVAQRDLVARRDRLAHGQRRCRRGPADRPASSGCSAVATLSRSLMTSAAFTG